MNTPGLLPDRWHTRDFPVLVEIARQLDRGEGYSDSNGIALPDLDSNDILAAFEALEPGYITANLTRSAGAGVVRATATGLTERGRRATGLWPREDAAADALVDLLSQAADNTSDEDDAGNLRRAGRLLKSVPGNVIADVTAALIRQQAGL